MSPAGEMMMKQMKFGQWYGFPTPYLKIRKRKKRKDRTAVPPRLRIVPLLENI
jgi:hypothetical protein